MKFNRSKWAMVGIVAACAMLLPMTAIGQAKKGRKSVRGKGRVSVDSFDQRTQSGGGATDLGDVEIEGRIFKPAVFFVLARSDFQYQAIEFKQSFLDRIIVGALRRPF